MQSMVSPNLVVELKLKHHPYSLVRKHHDRDTDFVCLQKIRNWGDGSFQYKVIATINPRETV